MKLILLLILTSCSTIPERRSSDANYANNIILRHNNVEYYGVGVLPEMSQYRLEFEAQDRIDKLTVVTCSKYITGKSNNNKMTINYHRSDLERRLDICQLYVEALNQKQKHSVGLFDFSDVKYKLKGIVNCNTMVNAYTGVSICQNFAGNWMTIAFDNQAKCISSCSDYNQTRRVHDIQVPAGKCLWLCNDGKDQHRLTTYGFEDEL